MYIWEDCWDIKQWRNTATLQTVLDQIEAKKATVIDLNTKILVTIEDAETLETEILETEEVMYNVAEKIALIKPLQPQGPPSAPAIQPPTPAN